MDEEWGTKKKPGKKGKKTWGQGCSGTKLALGRGMTD